MWLSDLGYHGLVKGISQDGNCNSACDFHSIAYCTLLIAMSAVLDRKIYKKHSGG